MPLSRSQTRAFVLVLVGIAVALSIWATVAILQGWNDDELQDRVRSYEALEEAEGDG